MPGTFEKGGPAGPSEDDYEKALDIAQAGLDDALKKAGDLDFLVAVMMIESAVNAAVDLTSEEDVLVLLRDLVEQIAQSASDD